MPAITQKVPNFLGGVSTQPDEVKLPGQVRDIINGYADPTIGLIKRPGSKFIAELKDTSNAYISPSAAITNGKWFSIFRDQNEKYIGVVQNGQIRVWDAITGVPKTVNYDPGTTSYLSSTGNYDVLSIYDQTLITNKDKVVAKLPDPTTTNTYQNATIVLRSVEYSAKYTVTINDQTYNLTTRNADDNLGPSDPPKEIISASQILAALKSGIEGLGISGLTVTQFDTSLELVRTGGNFTISAKGGQAGDALEAFQFTVKSGGTGVSTIAKLPEKSINGRLVKITNFSGGEDDFYVKYIGTDTGTTYTITESYTTGSGTYPVRGYLHVPETDNPVEDIIVLFHPSLGAPGVTPLISAQNFLNTAKDPKGLNLGNKIIFSCAYPQDNVDWNQATAEAIFPGITISSFYFGDNVPYVEAALLWAKNSINSYLATIKPGLSRDKIFTFGHSQGAYLAHRLNRLVAVDGVICNAPGPIDLLTRCQYSEANADESATCLKLKTAYGDTTANPSLYSGLGLQNFLNNTLSPTLYTQALDDTTGNAQGVPQVTNMQTVVQPAMEACGTCASVTFKYYSSGGHDSFAKNLTQQKDIREFINGGPLPIIDPIPSADVWEETLSPNASKGLDATTLPHVLIREPNGTFTFKQVDWEPRLVGDDNTNDHPSFVGRTIQKLFFHANRLGALSGESIVMSQSADYFNFYAQSALTQVASDPIDINVSSITPAELHSVIPVTQGLLLFSANQQFMVSAVDDIFSPSTVTVNTIASYENDLSISPVDMGVTIAFVSKTDSFSRIFEMQTRGSKENPSVAEVSNVVSEWIPASIDRMKASAQNSLLVLSSKNSNIVYTLRYYTENQERQLEAWMKWHMLGDVVHIDIYQDVVYVVTKQTNGYWFQTVNLVTSPSNPQITTPDGLAVDPRVDMWATPTSITYDPVTRQSTVMLPYRGQASLDSVVLVTNSTDPNDPDQGTTFEPTLQVSGSDYFYEIDGDWSSSDLVVGYKYNFEVELPRLYYRSGDSTDFTARLTIARILFNTGLSSSITFMLTARGRGQWTKITPTTQASNYLANIVPLVEGYTFMVPIHQVNQNYSLKVSSDTPYPVSLISMTWEGMYSPRYYRRA